MRKLQAYFTLFLTIGTCFAFAQNSAKTYLFVGSYTSGEKIEGIGVYDFNTETGELTEVEREDITSNYTDPGVSIFECNPDGSLQPFSKLIEFEGSSIVKGRQEEAHLHSSTFSPEGKYVFSPDLGSDKIRVLRFNHQGRLTVVNRLTIDTEPGAGPRHFTFHPTEPFAYCVEELSGSVSFYHYKNGHLSLSNTYRCYEHQQAVYSSADLHVSPDGRHLYISNRQDENSISIFEIDQQTGGLTLKGHHSTYGTIPRSFVIDPSGNYVIVANQTSNEIVVFRRNVETGLLTKISVTMGLTLPSSLKMRRYGN
jgi:6-phosphogluconolactonase (cycloisomerase 2 family)